MATEIVYLGHDNTIDLILKADGVAVDLAGVTKITLTLGTTLISSTNQVADPIRWNQAGYDTGEIRMALGAETITAADYRDAVLIVYDASNLTGIVWGELRVQVVDEVEAT